MTKRVLAAGLALVGASILGAHAYAGGAGGDPDKVQLALPQTMGLRVIQSATLRAPPTVWEAQVVDADRFAARGFPGAKVNDQVTITVLGEKRGNVKHAKSGKAANFKVKDDGKIERE